MLYGIAYREDRLARLLPAHRETVVSTVTRGRAGPHVLVHQVEPASSVHSPYQRRQQRLSRAAQCAFGVGSLTVATACGGVASRSVAGKDGGSPIDSRPAADETNFTVPHGVTPFDASGAVGAGNADCVDIEEVTDDLACATDDDCVAGYGGDICANGCWACENKDTVMNAAAAAWQQSELEALPSRGSPCGPCELPSSVPVACVGGKCVACGPDGGAGCGDAG